MSLLSLPERIFRRLVELPLELFSVILGSQKAIAMRDPTAREEEYDDLGLPRWTPILDMQTFNPARQYSNRYVTPENLAAIRRHEKRVQYRARHAGMASSG